MRNKVLPVLLAAVLTVSCTGVPVCAAETEGGSQAGTEASVSADQEAADKVAALIDAIYVQERTDTTDEDCKAA